MITIHHCDDEEARPTLRRILGKKPGSAAWRRRTDCLILTDDDREVVLVWQRRSVTIVVRS